MNPAQLISQPGQAVDDATLARLVRALADPVCATCGGTGLKPERYMGDPQGQEPCPDCVPHTVAELTDPRRLVSPPGQLVDDATLERLGQLLAEPRGAGGPGSGNFGHAGRPGEVGGSTSDADRATARGEFTRLKRDWSRVNDELFHLIDTPHSPEAQAKIHELKGLVKQMHTLNADPGGLEGIGLPGGPRDMVVVGAGPGGMACATMGGVDGLDTLLIDANPAVGGQAKFSSRIENYPGFPMGVTGDRLASDMHEQVQRVGADEKLGVRVVGLAYDPHTDLKTVTLSNGEVIETRSVVLAGGLEFKKIDFPGSDSPNIFYGDSQRLEKAGKGKDVVVAGGSNGAAQAALFAAQSAEHVTLVSRSPIEKDMSDYQVSALRYHPKVSVIEGDEIGSLSAGILKLKSGRQVKADAMGIFFGGISDTKWLPDTVKRENGKIVVNDGLETAIPGVFAVGDMRHKSIGRVGAAIGDGQLATHSVFQYFDRLKRTGKAFQGAPR